MVNLSFFLAVIFGGAATFFYMAGDARGMSGWANAACSVANTFCLHPEWPAIAAVVLLGVAAVLKVAGVDRG